MAPSYIDPGLQPDIARSRPPLPWSVHTTRAPCMYALAQHEVRARFVLSSVNCYRAPSQRRTTKIVLNSILRSIASEQARM